MRGFTFRETMSGPFSLESNSPLEGFREGKQHRHSLAIHVKIKIRDLARLSRDPSYYADLNGVIDFQPLGKGIVTGMGFFKLFNQEKKGDPPLMVYQLPFEHDHQQWCLIGVKTLSARSIFSIWPETTKLFTKLHRGPDETAPVVGAGILSLGPIRLAAMVLTMRAQPTQFFNTLSAAAFFLTYFTKSLWRIYISKTPQKLM